MLCPRLVNAFKPFKRIYQTGAETAPPKKWRVCVVKGSVFSERRRRRRYVWPIPAKKRKLRQNMNYHGRKREKQEIPSNWKTPPKLTVLRHC